MEAKYTHEEKREFARQMRKNPTPAERQLWYHLRQNRLGYKFQRHAQLAGYIVDFYCPSARIAIEVDGSIHETLLVKAQDAEKERVLESRDVRVLRFLNEDVLSFISVVITRIKSECEGRIALKALSGANGGGGVYTNSSSSRYSAKTDWNAEQQHRLQSKLAANPAENTVRVPPTSEDYKAINDTWRRLVRHSTVRSEMSIAENVNDQKLRLVEWLKKRNESAALTIKGMHVTDAGKRQA